MIDKKRRGSFVETKNRIIEEYKKLVKEKKTADITVAEICRNAGISRTTFYSYFHDRYEITETSLDKGTQRKTTENELPSLTQCTA